jgi:hypothetical protein
MHDPAHMIWIFWSYKEKLFYLLTGYYYLIGIKNLHQLIKQLISEVTQNYPENTSKFEH